MGSIRHAAVAGRFYPGSPGSCAKMADACLADAEAPAAFGGIVPHAGWVYSGGTAALGLLGVARCQPETVVIFGAVHGPDRNAASVYPAGAWETPLGSIAVDDELARAFAANPLIVAATEPHRFEHAIEVQLPLLQRCLADFRIVPVGVRPAPEAVEIGRYCGEVAKSLGRSIAFVGSTDLTHYGPAFGFEPHGRGAPGIRWAKDVNDRRFIRLIEALDAEETIPEAALNRNACGAGAVAATIAAVRAFGDVTYRELQHTCSAEVRGIGEPDAFNSVGYEAGVFVLASK